MKKLFYSLLFLFLAVATHAQTIQFTPMAFTLNGIGNPMTYSGPNVDSAWNSMNTSGGVLNGYQVYVAQLIEANGYSVDGSYGPVPQTALIPWKVLGQFVGSTVQPQLTWRYDIHNINLTDTGLTAIGTVPFPFLTTGAYIEGNNDTSGYTSNATVKIGTAAHGYDEIVASATPSLGSPTTAALTLVSPRLPTPANTTIYFHVTTAAVATTESAKSVVLMGTFGAY